MTNRHTTCQTKQNSLRLLCLQAAQAFAAWLTAHNGEHEEWHELSWLLLSGVPALLQLVSCVAPSTSTDTLR